MVATTHWLATAAGMAVLESGGTAADAAAAAGFALHVVEPHLNGPGGDMPLIVGTAGDPDPKVLCGQGTLPAAGHRRPAARRARADARARHRAAGRYRARRVRGLDRAAAAHGRLPLRDVLSYAIGFAADGHPVHPRVAGTIAYCEPLFREHWPTSGDRWLPAPAPGERLRQPALAETYRRLLAEAEAGRSRPRGAARGARRAWYEGFVARRSTRSPPRRGWTTPAARTPACSPATTWPAGGRPGSGRSPSTGAG
jgi:gamma-glutamyltranspeptidase/glutathione hydrolase